MPKKVKKVKKTKATRKPQPLPKSVQALLKYLGGSDVKVGGAARGGQPAQLAPTSINIAVSQQQAQQQAQQQSQQQQFVQQRVAPKGQVIGQSPLTSVISQQPIIIGLPQRMSDVEDRKKLEQEKKAEVEQNEINRRFGLLEASQQEFQQAAVGAYREVKQELSKRVTGDVNIFDARNLAAKFTSRPLVEEPQFEGIRVGEEPTEWTDVTEAGIYQAGQYLQNVTNPEMTAIERAKRGRKPLSEEVKKARAAEARIARETAKELKASVKQPRTSKKTKPADIASLLEENITTQNVMKNIAEQPSIIRFPKGGLLGRKPVSTAGAPDMATQISMLTSGGAAAVPQSQGINIAELMKAKKK